LSFKFPNYQLQMQGTYIYSTNLQINAGTKYFPTASLCSIKGSDLFLHFSTSIQLYCSCIFCIALHDHTHRTHTTLRMDFKLRLSKSKKEISPAIHPPAYHSPLPNHTLGTKTAHPQWGQKKKNPFYRFIVLVTTRSDHLHPVRYLQKRTWKQSPALLLTASASQPRSLTTPPPSNQPLGTS